MQFLRRDRQPKAVPNIVGEATLLSAPIGIGLDSKDDIHLTPRF
jgi:hypothetical protein